LTRDQKVTYYPPVTDDDLVFKALADPTRRQLLDRLFARDGQTLSELEQAAAAMTRFGVMKHLRLLEAAGLVVTRRSGREKLHFLNPVPVRLIHDRWIDKFTERPVAALTGLKAELEEAMSEQVVKVFEIYIKAPVQAVWDAITTPEWTARYGYKALSEYDLRPGGAFVARANEQMRSMGLAEVIIDGEVVEVEPPHRLVQTWRFLFTDQTRAEGFTRITWEVATTPGGFTRLTVTHDLTGAPQMAGMITSKFNGQGGGGWSWILSDLKSLLETGSNL
jgi:uncharacterized protein YndB with AHSA1/START domain/DNA-binding transcriptional ArsR family regulator